MKFKVGDKLISKPIYDPSQTYYAIIDSINDSGIYYIRRKSILNDKFSVGTMAYSITTLDKFWRILTPLDRLL